jgi:hypothetical protein
MLSNKGLSICPSKGVISVIFDRFDRVLRSANDSVSGIKLSINESPLAYNTIRNFRPGKTIGINNFHKMLGHCGTDRFKKISKIHSLKLSGEYETCAECAIAKARQKNINKEWKGGSQIPGEQVYLDISVVTILMKIRHFMMLVVKNDTSLSLSS